MSSDQGHRASFQGFASDISDFSTRDNVSNLRRGSAGVRRGPRKTLQQYSTFSHVASILNTVPFFQKSEETNSGLVVRVAAAAKVISEPANSVLFRQGDPGENCYIVLTGEVGVFVLQGLQASCSTPRYPGVDTKNDFVTLKHHREERLSQVGGEYVFKTRDRFRTVDGNSTYNSASTIGESTATLGQGALFGEKSLSENCPRNATTKCLTDCDFAVIGRQAFECLQKDLILSAETQVITSLCQSLTEQCGSVLKAWRRVLDPKVRRELVFTEFAEALATLSWHGNMSMLWGTLRSRAHANGRDSVVSLQEISLPDHLILEGFKEWVQEQYGGAIKMFDSLTGNKASATLPREQFCSACSDFDSIDDIWDVLDLDGSGAISLKDVAYLEVDGLIRKAIVEPSFAHSLQEAKEAEVMRKRRMEMQNRAKKAALTEFMKKVRASAGGSFIRGFRRYLDTNGNFVVSKVELRKACQKIGFSGDVTSLWRVLDRDLDGSVQLTDLDAPAALVLASFKTWAIEKHRSCVRAILSLGPRQASTKWSQLDFTAALSTSGWRGPPEIPFKQAASTLYEAADVTGFRAVSANAFVFLDPWAPMPYLCTVPDPSGKERLLQAMRSRYGNVIVAWRRLFDRRNENRVTYKEFSEVCNAIPVDNPEGIWRALDTSHSGFLGLNDIDHEAAKVLMDFKEWAEDALGTLRFAHKVMDHDNSGAVSWPIFRRALEDFGFKGDIRLLFLCLKPGASGRQGSRDAQLSFDDMKHLEAWERRDAVGDMDTDEESRVEASPKPISAGNIPSPYSVSQTTLPKLGNSSDAGADELRQSGDESQSGTETVVGRKNRTEYLYYCKCPGEYMHFREASEDRIARRRSARRKPSRLVADILQAEPNEIVSRGVTAQSGLRAYKSPAFNLPLGSLPSVSPCAGVASRRSKATMSMSLGALPTAGRRKATPVGGRPAISVGFGTSLSLPALDLFREKEAATAPEASEAAP